MAARPRALTLEFFLAQKNRHGICARAMRSSKGSQCGRDAQRNVANTAVASRAGQRGVHDKCHRVDAGVSAAQSGGLAGGRGEAAEGEFAGLFAGQCAGERGDFIAQYGGI